MNSIIKKFYAIIVITLFCALAQNVFAVDISNQAVEGYIRQEYNRGFEHVWDLSVAGGATFFDLLETRGGFSYGQLGDTPEIKAFASAGVSPFAKRPWWNFSALYIYNNLTDYDVSAHSILPLATRSWRRAGVTFGPNFRFTSYFGEPVLFESMISYSGHYDVIRNEYMRFRAVLGNYNEFVAKTIGTSSLVLNTEMYITNNLTFVNDMQFFQSGNEALTTNFYGIAWRGGVKYSW